jgi:hypothetical protein
MAGQNYRDLIAWQKAMDLVEGVYRLTRQFPRDELYGLTSQVRRAAVSVPSNIAEGQGRGGDAEFCRFSVDRACLGPRIGNTVAHRGPGGI